MIKRITLLLIISFCCLPLTSEAFSWKKSANKWKKAAVNTGKSIGNDIVDGLEDIGDAFCDAAKDVCDCAKDPCNCGDKDPFIHESWGDYPKRKTKRNRNCPPYNRGDGRKNNTCLVQPKFNYPGQKNPYGFVRYYQHICGEAVASKNPSKPQIRVRSQSCNSVACWSRHRTLEKNGDCFTFPGPYAIPLSRICARISLPKYPDTNMPQDPGYTNGKHLDEKGEYIDDPKIYNSDGEEVNVEFPKLCLYNDPSFLDFTHGIDFMDVNPDWQPLHKTKETNPIIVVIRFIFQMAVEVTATIDDLLAMLWGLIADNTDGGFSDFAEVMEDIISWIADAVRYLGKGISWFLSYIGRMNNIVLDKEYGCVNLPMGPFPPPYCPNVAPFVQIPTIYKICPKDSDGNIIDSTSSDAGCVVSTLNNNFISNSVRVGYETLMPLCGADEDPMQSDSCVTIKNLGNGESASALHINSFSRDLIQPCTISASGEPCIESMLSFSCSADNDFCKNGFRVVYGKQLGSTLTEQLYFNSDLPDCTSSITTNCQKIWGVNRGEYKDINLTFPENQTFSDIAPLHKTFNLVDKNGATSEFYASIVRESETDISNHSTQDPDQICVFGDVLTDSLCADRIDPPNILVSKAPESTYFSPKIIAKYSANGDETSSTLEPASVYNTDDSTNIIVNLAGTDLESFVTDEQFKTKPFYGERAPNPASVFGIYQGGDDVWPIRDGVTNDNAIYLKGLEYINGEYNLGGKYVCLAETGLAGCSNKNKEMCVLTNRLNKDIVNCSIFDSKTQKQEYVAQGGLNRCTGSELNCGDTRYDYITANDNTEINIMKCDVSTDSDDNLYCYESDVELCTTSYDINNRVSPAPDITDISSTDQYYDITNNTDNASGTIYTNTNTTDDTSFSDNYVVRSKTSLERGLCEEITQPTCSQEDDDSDENGHVIWPETQVGEMATKQTGAACQAGYVQDKDIELQRYCTPNADDGTFAFEPLYRIQEDGSKKYIDGLCKRQTCVSAIATPSSGYATWTEVQFGEESVGTCKDGYTTSGPLTRSCNLADDGVTVTLGPMSNTCSAKICVAETEPTAANGYATWEKAEFGEESIGICKDKYASLSPVKRSCILSSDKKSVEFGAVSENCQPSVCLAETDPSRDNNYATWPETTIGNKSSGTCRSGYKKNGSLTRSCSLSSDGSGAKFDSIEGGCDLMFCEARKSQHAKFERTPAGETAIGTCLKGYNKKGDVAAQCIVSPDNNSVSWGPVSGKCKEK